MSPTSAPKRVSKACDACKLRKVKCNGQERCQQCTHLGLRCVYSTTSRTRSQGKRGRIISEYKSKTTGAHAGSPPSILPAGMDSTGLPSPHGISPFLATESVGASTLASPVFVAPRFNQDFFLDLIPDYVDGVYPVQPVIAERELRDYIAAMEADQETRAFVHAFGACTLNLTRLGAQRTDDVLRDIEALVNYAIEHSKPVFKSFRSSVMRAMQSMFIHNCLMSMQASDAAFYYMRDAISAIQLLRVDHAETMASLFPLERSQRQRLYWQAFIYERFVAILDYRLAILPPLDVLPENDPSIPVQVREGFTQIIKLFRLLDQDFIANWVHSQGGGVTSSWVEAKSRELEGDEEQNAAEFAKLSTMQRADLAITREWLRTLVWRLAMGETLLSSRSSKECLSLLFPVRLSQNLRTQVSSMSRQDIEVHGSSIAQKLFEITDTIADVLLHVPAGSFAEVTRRIEDYLFVLDFVLQFPTLDATRRGILLEKLERLQAMFPEVVSTASSPALPFEMQSPAGDPWVAMASSKVGADGANAVDYDVAATSMAPMGLTPAVGQQLLAVDDSQHATWNNISRRLSMATFAVD